MIGEQRVERLLGRLCVIDKLHTLGIAAGRWFDHPALAWHEPRQQILQVVADIC